jgi:hypothetical protein
MTANTLNALKGWPSQSAVDYSTKLDSSITTTVLAGSVVHVDPTSGHYKLGNAADQVPLFTFQNSDDPDVANDGGDAAADKGVWVPVSPSGNIMALVATGAYELTSTQYDGVAGDFSPNVPLTGLATGKIDATAYNSGLGVCGVVSRKGLQDNGYGHDCIAFWPYFLPKLINTA